MTDGICPFATYIGANVRTFNEGMVDRVGFCDHTAGGYLGTLSDPGFWNKQGVSTHFAIGQKGEIVQIVNIFATAWAQGRDARGNSVSRTSPNITWKPFAEMGYQNPNGYLISTEHEDKTVTNYVWSEAMYEADLKVKRWCIEEVKRVTGKDLMRFGIDSLAGHFMFDPVNRVYCPGNGWPRERLYADLAGTPKEEDEMYTVFDGWGLEGLNVNPGERAVINARKTFNLPPEAKSIEIEFLGRGYGVVEHGSTHTHAGRFGWGQAPGIADGYGHCRVELGPDGEFTIFAEDANNPPALYRGHVTGIYS